MAECVVCGERLRFFEGGSTERCEICVENDFWPDGHPNQKPEQPDQMRILESRKKELLASTTQHATLIHTSSFFSRFGRIAAFVILACSLLVGLTIASEYNVLLGLTVIISGMLTFFAIGLLAEISSNIIQLAKNVENSDLKKTSNL